MTPGGTYGGVPLTHAQSELLRRLWREPGANSTTVMAAFAAAAGRTVSQHTAYNHRPRGLAPVRERKARTTPLTPEESQFLAAAWRRPGASGPAVAAAFEAAFGRRPAKETVYGRRPADLAPAPRRPPEHGRRPVARGPSRPPRRRRGPAVKRAIAAAYLGPPPPPPARVPVAAPGPLTPGQEEALARLWALYPHRPAPEIAARFAEDTGRLIDAATAQRHRPWPPPTAEELEELGSRAGKPAACEDDDEDAIKARLAIVRRASVNRFISVTTRGPQPPRPRTGRIA
jgi:hypothetical protein